LAGRKVLIVDDSRTIRREVSEALTRAGFTVIEAADGEEGYASFKANEDLALAVLDVNMPRLNGLDLLDRLKADSRMAAVPVLVMTTEVDPALIERAKRSGAKGWLIKPVKLPHLVSAVSKLVK
jgi:two-component system chemotaxis response regulator CheY